MAPMPTRRTPVIDRREPAVNAARNSPARWRRALRRTLARSGTALGLAAALAIGRSASRGAEAGDLDPLQWPAAGQTMRPWTRWWWLGSGVDPANLQRMLGQFHDAGLGGVEICPIYGAKGYESRFIPYLSSRWMDMLAVTTQTAARLDLGVDLTTGTGWPMGGPWVPRNRTSESVQIGRPAGPGDSAPIVVHESIQRVKRAAPGGEGYVIDPFSTAALDAYLARFDQAFLDYGAPLPRAQFQDSYEFYGADWTPQLPVEFARRRGYDLRAQAGALAGFGDPDVVARVREDYRRTLAELHREFVARWTAWSHDHGGRTREQAHGAPANIEDVYATADIPETEGSFGAGTEDQIPMMKFASSAAHATGKRLASSETFTWLGEHFQVSLAQLKPAVDTFFLAGINHIFLHGTPYSPADAPWPGWLFYASVNFGPNGGIWHDLPAFNAYVTRCQSILQRGRPDNDVLLYFPVADFWQRPPAPPGAPDPLVIQFTTPGTWMVGTPFHRVAMELWRTGYSFDEVTDDLLGRAASRLGRIELGENSYQAIVVPPCHYLPPETLERLIALARAGANLIFVGEPPTDVPGWAEFASRRRELRQRLAALHLQSGRTPAGDGAVFTGSDLAGPLLDQAGVHRERLVDLGLQALRRARADGTDYFIVNRGSSVIAGWVPLARPAAAAILLDPLDPNRIGRAALRLDGAETSVYLQLAPGQSLVARLFGPAAAPRLRSGPAWKYLHTASPSRRRLAGPWSVHFVEGGPVLPSDYSTPTASPWTDRDDPDARRFAGTARYTLDFDFDPTGGSAWALSLGPVADSARISLNGRAVAILWCPPYRVPITRYLQPGRNRLEIDVTNVAANRIRDLDRRRVAWKDFYEINFVGHNYKPFDASGWPVRTAGLIGPVELVPESAYFPGDGAR